MDIVALIIVVISLFVLLSYLIDRFFFHFLSNYFGKKSFFLILISVTALITTILSIFFDSSTIKEKCPPETEYKVGAVPESNPDIIKQNHPNKKAYDIIEKHPIGSDNFYDHKEIDKLVKGRMAFYVPETMELAETYKAFVSITKALNDSILLTDFNTNQSYQIEGIKITSRVKVFLIDPSNCRNFDIMALNTDEQLVDDSTNTIWRWSIIPKRHGTHELDLRVTVKVLDRLGENYRDITVFEKTIIVNGSILMTLRQFIIDYWQWLTSVCFIPLIIWIYNRLSKRKKDTTKRNQIKGFKTEI